LVREIRVPSPKTAKPRSTFRRGMGAGRWLMLAVLLAGLDQLTKLAIANTLQLGQHIIVTSWFNIVRVHNSGAAFSFLADAGGWQRWFFVGLGFVAVAYLGFLMAKHASQTWFAFAATLIIAGAIGNTIDRLAWGVVIDFIDWHVSGWHWPAFNLADSYITVGAVLFILDELRRVRRG
jgi:signal peptidase II